MGQITENTWPILSDVKDSHTTIIRRSQRWTENMTGRTPKISVGMPAYNSEKWIAASVESILCQTFEDFELIISDNGSSDGTEEICRRYADQDPRVIFVRQPTNIGASANYSFVFEAAQAPFFKWASSNDLCEATFLERCLPVLEQSEDVTVCYPRTRLFTDDPENGEDYHYDLELLEDSPCQRFESFLRGMGLNNVMNGVIRSEALAKTPLVRPYLSSDVVLMAELALHGKFIQVPEYLYLRRMDKESSTKHMTWEEARKHWDPQKKSRMLFQSTRIHLGYLGAAFRAPLSASERICMLRKVLRNAIWNRDQLAADVSEALLKMRARKTS